MRAGLYNAVSVNVRAGLMVIGMWNDRRKGVCTICVQYVQYMWRGPLLLLIVPGASFN